MIILITFHISKQPFIYLFQILFSLILFLTTCITKQFFYYISGHLISYFHLLEVHIMPGNSFVVQIIMGKSKFKKTIQLQTNF